jgi:hypothetical protein
MSKSLVTTVLTPATTRDLTLLATFKDDWDVTVTTDDGFLARAITRCSAAALKFCNRAFAIETVQDRIDLGARRGMVVNRQNVLQLSRWPVASITSILVDGKTLTEGVDFITHATVGQLSRIDSSGDAINWRGRIVTVVYIAGYVLPGQDPTAFPSTAAPIPPDLEDAVGRMVYTRYAERQRDPLIRSEKAEGVYSVEYLTPSGAGNLSSDVEDILDNYRVPVIG